MSYRLLNQEFDFWMSIWILAGVMTNYPKVEYSELKILKDTKNILYQNFVEKYCKQMQVVVTFVLSKFK